MVSPPSETGASDDRARLETAKITTLIGQLREINSAAPTGWVNEGWRLLAEYQNSGSLKHLTAFCRHVTGIRARMAGLRKTPQPRGHSNARCRDRKTRAGSACRGTGRISIPEWPSRRRALVRRRRYRSARQVIQNLHCWRKGWAMGRLRRIGKTFPKPARFVDARTQCDFKTALREAAEWLGQPLNRSNGAAQSTPNKVDISNTR